MLRNSWRPIVATTAVVGTTGYIYHVYSTRAAAERTTFELPVRVKGAGGKKEMSTRTISMLPMAEVEKRLSANATAETIRRPGGLVWKHTTASLPSNDPMEDANAHALLHKGSSSDMTNDDLLFFAVMDGHGGPHTSRLLSKTLIPAVSLQLSRLRDEPSSFMPKATPLEKLKEVILGQKPTPIPYDSDPTYVSLAIQTAFAMLDSDIINGPLRILAEHYKNSSEKIPDLSKHPMALATMLPAMSGSCALMALIDPTRRDLYVACTGDCRAVAGVWEQDANGEGLWRVETLTEDQTGRNAKELKRIQSEHPGDEAAYVIQRGRVLGGLEPSRAFGDARYKWPADIQHLLSRVFLTGNDMQMPPTPPNLKTPPYVTCQPVITHRKLSLPPHVPNLPDSDTSRASPIPTLRFIVLATDGLWDQLSSTEVVSLVGGHLAGLSGSIAKKDLKALVPTALSSDPSAQTVEGKGDRQEHGEGAWAFVDSNVSTHLIRNAFGGASTSTLRKLLSIPAPLSRNYRDDVTVTVLWWEDGTNDIKHQTLHATARL